MLLKQRQLRERKKIFLRGIFFVLILITILYVYVYLLANPIIQTHRYPLTSEPITNPLMGWAPWATIRDSEQPHTLVYADLTWRDFEPQEGVYDFKTFEKENQIARWQKEGKRVVFRFVLDKPGDVLHLDIPDWLFEKINRDGDFYHSSYGSGFSPNYSNPVLIGHHRRAIAELGNCYKKKDLIVYIELGSLGHWGEWHVDLNAGIRSLPLESVRDLYVQHYLDAFPNTHLLMRRPFSIAANMGLGLYNDMTGDFYETNTWLEWIENGGEYSQTGEVNGLTAMPDGWKVAPIGGEQSINSEMQDIYGRNFEETLQLIQNSHTTFIGPWGPVSSKDSENYQNQIDQVLSTIGYRLYIESFQLPSRVRLCDSLRGKIRFGNKGIAPIYYNWPTILYLFDKDQALVLQLPLETDLRKILPGEILEISFSVPLADLSNGIYSIGLGIVDPISGQPAIKLAMNYSSSNLIFELASFEVKKSDFGTLFMHVPGICTGN